MDGTHLGAIKNYIKVKNYPDVEIVRKWSENGPSFTQLKF